MTIRDLYNKKKNLFNQAEDLKNLAEKENRQLNDEERGNFKKYLDDIDAIDEQIALETRANALNGKMGEPIYDSNDKPTGKLVGEKDAEWQRAFSKYLRLGHRALTMEETSVLNLVENSNGMGVPIDPTGELRTAQRNGMEQRASNSVVTNPTYFNPVTMATKFNETLKAIGPWMEAVTVINDDSGNDLVLPYYNDAGNDGYLESAGTDAIASSADLDAAKVTLSNYWMSSTGIKANWATLRDSAYPVDTFIVQPLMKRLARKINYYATLGTGSSEPKGIAICAVTGELASKATVPTATDMNNLLRLVDYAYHTGPSSGWMFHSDTMFRIASTVKSTTYNTEPLWQPGLAAGIPSTLYGYKYWINNNINTITTAPGNSMLFGDFSYFVMRYVGPVIITRLEERYAELGQVGFLISQFMDSNVSMVGTTYAPIKKIKNIMT